MNSLNVNPVRDARNQLRVRVSLRQGDVTSSIITGSFKASPKLKSPTSRYAESNYWIYTDDESFTILGRKSVLAGKG